ncbi:MAG: polysaccharide deacetylase family protein [Bacteroidetes bacterium]|nr:polysaccharide deacetylase family protein [Bacteroidota bacterium]
MFYFVKTPWLLKKCYPSYCWDIPSADNAIYLTFDDGPHPNATPFVLDQLKKYQAKATFFCIGKNVVSYPDIYARILHEGHRVGNHTHNHLNGWKSSDSKYLSNVEEAAKYIDSNLFRPPYGRITRFQASCLQKTKTPYKIIMWDVLSADFDLDISAEKTAKNVINNSKNGSIIVFHDSEKAFARLETALPMLLDFFSEKAYQFKVVS